MMNNSLKAFFVYTAITLLVFLFALFTGDFDTDYVIGAMSLVILTEIYDLRDRK